MSSDKVENVLEAAIIEIQKQVTTNESSFLICLKQFHELVKQKLEKNGKRTPDQNIANFAQKVDSMLEKKNQLQSKRRALHEYTKRERNFKLEIIERNNALNIECQKQFEEVLAAERAMYKQEMTLAKSAFQMREDQEYRLRIEEMKTRLGESRTTNIFTERGQRKEWIRRKDGLQKILDDYDTQMTEQQNELEFLTRLNEHEICELQRYKILCEEQDKMYHDLMQEKEEYLESVRQQKLNEIRVRMAQRTIVKFIEQFYPAWKKKKLKAMKKKSKYRSRYAH